MFPGGQLQVTRLDQVESNAAYQDQSVEETRLVQQKGNNNDNVNCWRTLSEDNSKCKDKENTLIKQSYLLGILRNVISAVHYDPIMTRDSIHISCNISSAK